MFFGVIKYFPKITISQIINPNSISKFLMPSSGKIYTTIAGDSRFKPFCHLNSKIRAILTQAIFIGQPLYSNKKNRINTIG